MNRLKRFEGLKVHTLGGKIKNYLFFLAILTALVFVRAPAFGDVIEDCFVTGTQILMGDRGYKPIEEVQEGDIVATVNWDTLQIENKQVTSIIAQYHTGKGSDYTIRIDFSDGTVNQNTNTHPYYVVGKGLASYLPDLTKQQYNLEVRQLEIGDRVYRYSNGSLTEVFILTITEILEGVQTYNLMGILDNPSFFANNILVHNKNGGGNGDDDDGDGDDDDEEPPPPPDQDNDGIPDSEDPDVDGDIYSNETELRAGTDPYNPNDVPIDLEFEVARMRREAGLPPVIPQTGDPINPLTGEHVFSRVDLQVPATGLPFTFERSYGSRSPIDGPLGLRWTHSYNRRLVMNWDYSMDVRDERGWRSHYRFIPDPEVPVDSFDGDPLIEIRLDQGRFESSVLNTNTLVRNADGSYTERTREGIAYRYDGYWTSWRGSNQPATAGRLAEISDPNGNRMSFHYDGEGRLIRIVDTVGREYALIYSGSFLVELQDPAGRRVEYRYDASGRLSEVVGVDGANRRYEYDSEGKLLRRTNPLGDTFLYTYDGEGRLVEVRLGDGRLYNRFSYYAGTGSRTEYRDERGGLWVYSFDEQGHLLSLRDPTGAETRYFYDEAFNRTRIVGALGQEQRFGYDERKNVVQFTDALGNSYSFSYEPAFSRLVSLIDPLGSDRRFSYDASGNLLSSTNPLGRVTRFSYDSAGRLLSVRNAEGETVSYSYDSQGNIRAVRDASGAVTELDYDGVGRILSVANPVGASTRMAYDAADRLIRLVDALGGEHRYSYDLLGNLLSYRDPSGATFRWSYNSLGQMVERLDALNSMYRYRYDLGDKLLESEDPLGRTYSYGYDAVGRLAEARNPAGSTTRYEYDALGRLVRAIDALGRVRRFDYDAAGRLTALTEVDQTAARYFYDAAGRLVRMEDPAGNVFRFTYDRAGQLIEELSTQGRIGYVYDGAGRLSRRTDIAGRTTRFDYDPRGLLTEVAYPDQTIRYRYDAARRMVEASNPAGTERYSYDQLDRMTAVENLTLGKTLRYAYDARGLRTELVDPAGKVFRYAYDAAGRLTRFTDPAGELTQYSYDALSRLQQMRYPNGADSRYSYDVSGWLSQLTVRGTQGEIFSRRYRYDSVGNAVQESSGGGATWSYAYELRDRLVEACYPQDALEALRRWPGEQFPPGQAKSLGGLLPEGQIVEVRTIGGGKTKNGNGASGKPPQGPPGQEKRKDDSGESPLWPEPYGQVRYGYDAVGNRLEQQADGNVVRYSYGVLNRLLEADGLRFVYDAAGNVAQRLAAGEAVRYSYNARNELTLVEFADGTWVRYRYDAFGRLVYREESYWQNRNQQKTEITHYLYDGLEVLMEYSGGPGQGLSPLAEYYRAGGSLVARKMIGYHGRKEQGHEEFVRTRGGLLYVHTDRLGSVVALTDRKGEVVMRYAYEAFGQPWAGIYGPYNRYGFTGKPYDEKTGLYYYGARWYDPQVGRWMSQDPIRDGVNWYAYVNNNPVNFVDPWGLSPEEKEDAETNAYKLSVGVRAAIVVGGLVEFGVVWDEKGNIGIALTGGVGTGVELSLGPQWFPTPSASSEKDISDFAGKSTEAKASFILGISYDIEEKELEGIELLGVGGGVYWSQTIVIPIVKGE